MHVTIRNSLRSMLGAAALLTLAAPPAWAIDWSGVQGKEIILFYPGQASWEWVLTKSDHSGGPKLREGKTCKECHEKEEKTIGEAIASGKRIEPTPIAGKRGSIPVNVKMSHDGERLYVRLEWPDAPPPGEKLDPEFPVKAALMFDDEKVKEVELAGCWNSCHDDATRMASAAEGKELRKYLTRSRTKITRSGGGENLKPQAELDAMRADGQFLEYWQAKLKPGAPAVAVDGYVLERREENPSPIVTVEGALEGDKWVVTLSRALKPGVPGYKEIVPGKTYHVGFAIHDGHAAVRFHHVSWGYSFALDSGDADFIAAKR